MLGSQIPWTKVSQVEVLITRACDPSLPEPNYAAHLEVAEYINQKKANTPREAAMLIARLANHRNPHIAMLALALLDTVVQSCGYPFHLQISTKEFLNELVRRFPERPPPFPGPVMSRILEMIHSWKEGIASESRWKEDLGNIRDMHRLLTFKGYRFRDFPRQPSLASASNIKSAEELEEEDREAQSAKLQELIRRGTPRDLAAAQDLMKALAGANPDAKPDYRSQALTDLNKLEQKVILLNEMLDNSTRGERLVSGDVYDQVATILKSARPKIQKWISDAETEDSESLDTFLQINDQINTVLNRYEAFKQGDYVTSSNPIPVELATSSTTNELSLIDFDDSAASNNKTLTSATDDIMSLFGPSSSTSASSGPSVANTAAFAPSPMNSNGNRYGMTTMGGISGAARPLGTLPTTFSPSPPPEQPQFGAIMLPGTPGPHDQRQSGTGPRVMSPNYFSNNGQPQKPINSDAVRAMSSPQQPQRQPAVPGSTSGAGQPHGKDPFADLAGLF